MEAKEKVIDLARWATDKVLYRIYKLTYTDGGEIHWLADEAHDKLNIALDELDDAIDAADAESKGEKG